jgi:hypothetical protein
MQLQKAVDIFGALESLEIVPGHFYLGGMRTRGGLYTGGRRKERKNEGDRHGPNGS